jgi:peptidoglycan/xylan/chitin deacetylase (PgdA/CDA1 family)
LEQEFPQPSDFLTAEEIDDWCAGMTEADIAELDEDPLFTVEVHTKDHPMLTLCDREEQYHQLKDSKDFLERICRKTCRTVAYPAGDYDESVLSLCKNLGLTTGFAVEPRMGTHPRQELSRIGIARPCREILGFKVRWGNHLRRLRVPFG